MIFFIYFAQDKDRLYPLEPDEAVLTCTHNLFCLFVWVEALRPSQQFFIHVGTEPPLPGYYRYFFGR